MNERLLKYREQITNTWDRFTGKQKMLIASITLFVIIFLGIYIYIASQPVYKPLYNERLSEQEIGTIKQELDRMQVPYNIINNGTGIEVPQTQAQDVIVELAAQGIPKQGGISSEIFNSANMFGTTNEQLQVMKKDALQQEVENLLQKVSGVRDAQVILTLPEEELFVGDPQDNATASVLINQVEGARLEPSQIKSLYYIVSRSVPNLPIENITITNQYSETLQMEETGLEGNVTAANKQEKVKADIQNKVQQDVQKLLGTIMGRDKVIVQATVKVNFDQVREENKLVTPVDKENNQGIDISVQELTKTFNGEGAAVPGGVAGSGQNDVVNYPGTDQQGSKSNYEEIQRTVNKEVNRINQEITRSPYKVEDISINVGVEPPENGQLDQATVDAIKQVLRNTVRVMISEKGQELTPEQLDQHISVFARPFSGKVVVEEESPLQTYLMYGAAALALLAVAGVAFAVLRRRKEKIVEEEIFADIPAPRPQDVPDLEYDDDSEETVVRKQLEKLARSNPDEFVVLLRTWLAEE